MHVSCSCVSNLKDEYFYLHVFIIQTVGKDTKTRVVLEHSTKSFLHTANTDEVHANSVT